MPLARITHGGPRSPRSSAEEDGLGECPPKKQKLICPRCASCLYCLCPPQAPRPVDLHGGGAIPNWRAAEHWAPAPRPGNAWPIKPIPQRPVFIPNVGVLPVPTTVRPPPPPVWVNTMAKDGGWRAVDVPRHMLLPPNVAPSVRVLPLFEDSARSASIESVCSSTAINNDEAVESGDAGAHLDLELRL